jgi:uncharacterized membrane protein YfcA
MNSLSPSPSAVEALLLGLAAAGGGVMNAIAGGGTLLTFPALIWLGESAIVANATSTAALLPGSAASFVGYRREVATHREWLGTLLLPSVLGGGVGGALLLLTPERTFAALAPLLVLFATLLFALQGVLARRHGDRPPIDRRLAAAAQFLVAVYGGYFGAGIGILMLAIMGFLGLRDIHAMNGLKAFFGFAINAVAALVFIVRGAVDWPVLPVMIAGAIAGGYGGARLARFIGRDWARRAVVGIGLFVATLLFLQRP